MPVKEGDTIKIEYTGTLEDGSVFDSSESHGKPLEFKVGAKQVVKGVDEAVKGMELNEEKQFTIEPEQGYGKRNDQLVQKVPKKKFPKEMDIKEGTEIGLNFKDGQVQATIGKITDKEVEVDLNHPLAGKKMTFKVKVVAIN